MKRILLFVLTNLLVVVVLGMVGSLLGVLVIATLEAGLAQLGASEPLKRIVTGGAIIAAVAADALRRRWEGERG